MTDILNPEEENRIEQELLDEEVLLWAGRPTPLRTLGGSNLYTVAMALISLIIVLVILAVSRGMMFMDLGPGSPMMGAPNAIFGLVTLIMLLSMGGVLLSPLWRLLNARRTLYAITDQRILILDGILSQKVTSYGADDIERIERRSYSTGRGDLIFRHETRTQRVRSSRGYRRTRYYEEPIGFFGIPDVRAVERVMIDTFMAGQQPYPKAKRKNDDLEADEYDEDYTTTLADLLPGMDPDETEANNETVRH